MLQRRAGRWTDDAGGMARRMESLRDTILPSELVMSVWRYCFYGWCTTARFAQEVVDCRFCGRDAGYRQQHYSCCVEARRWIQRFGAGAQPNDEDMPRWIIEGSLAEPTISVKMASALDARAAAFDAKRHGSSCAVQSVCTARLKELRHCHAVIREVARSPAPP